MNQLPYGDNLQVLREHIADESVDLIYLDRRWTRSDYDLLLICVAPEDVETSNAQSERFG